MASKLPMDEDGFSIVPTGSILQVLTGNIVRWSIDPGNFGPAASVSLLRDEDRIEIGLDKAVFPGTSLDASFRCTLLRSEDGWAMSLRSALGMSLDARWIEWLHRRQHAVGWWRTGPLEPFPGFSLTSRDALYMAFSPDWVLSAKGPGSAALGSVGPELEVSGWKLALNHPERIAGTEDGRTTTFSFERGNETWPLSIARGSEDGWNIGHEADANLFDELRVEALDSPSGLLHTGLLTQRESNREELRFFPGGGFFATSGEPFHLALQAPRLAFSLRQATTQSALAANLKPTEAWAHTDALSLRFGGSGENEPFELTDDGNQPCCLTVAPVISSVQCPADGDCTINLKFDKPRPTSLNWAKIAQPVERVLGSLHLLPGEHQLAFDLSCGDVLTVVRPSDMLKLDFEFQGVRLSSGRIHKASHGGQTIDPLKAPAVGETTLEPSDSAKCPPDKCLPASDGSPNCARLYCIPNGLPRVTVTFPPQHVNEQAFFHTDDSFTSTKKFKLGDVEANDIIRRSGNPAMTPADAQKLADPDVGSNSSSTSQTDTAPTQGTMIAGESNLVFDPNLTDDGIPFRLEHLLDWSKWTPIVHPVAQVSPTPANPALPAALSDISGVTAIELPYRLFLSPSDRGQWAHADKLVEGKTSKAVELWHTRLAVKNGNAAPDENNQKDRIARAIYSPDLAPGSSPLRDHQSSGTRFPLDSRDRQELVHLTSNQRINSYTPLPVQLDHLMLTPLGGYLKSLGRWQPPLMDSTHVLTVEQWKHIATLGRDQYVRVVYKGYLAPFSHRAALIKVSERRFVHQSDGWYAFLHQRMYIVVHYPRRDFALFGQPKGGRNFPFKRIDALTLVTPDLDDPNAKHPGNAVVTPTQSLFWPYVGGQPFYFKFRFWDMENNISEATLPVVFGDAEQSQTVANCMDMIKLYNAGSGAAATDYGDAWTCTPFNNQSIAFAPTTKPGDTRYDSDRMCWQIALTPSTQTQVYQQDLPLFYPILPRAKFASATIKRITGDGTPAWVRFFDTYVESGFDPKANAGEVILQVDDANRSPALKFGAAGKTDQAGGLSSPDSLVVGFSRKSGAVGGTKAKPTPVGSQPQAHPSLTTWASGTFNPADFFGGFTSAKLLGAVKLSDIIAPLLGGLDSNLGQAPRMVEQELFQIEAEVTGFEDDAVALIRTLQSDVAGNPLAKLLSTQAQAAYAAQTARNANATADALTLALYHASLIQAIVAYGEALNSALQDPAQLVAEAADSLLQALLNDPAYTGLISTLQSNAALLVAQLSGALLGAINAVANQFLPALQALQVDLKKTAAQIQNCLVNDPLPIPPPTGAGAAFQRTQIALEKLAPEIFALIGLVPVVQDLVSNINQAKSAAAAVNLPGVVQRLGAAGKDLLAIQQGLGVLGIAVPVPSIVQQAKDIQRTLIRLWDTGKTVNTDFKDLLAALQSSCTVLAAQPVSASFPYSSATQVLQNLRQIQRALAHLDALRSSNADVAAFFNNPTATLADNVAHRWLQRIQQLQRQVIQSANALQKVATDAIQAADPALVEAGATLLIQLVPPVADATSLIEQITAFTKLANAAGASTIENLVAPLLTNPQIAPILSVQIAGIESALSSARSQLSAITGQNDLKTLRNAVLAAAATDINPSASPNDKVLAHRAIVTAAAALVRDKVIDQIEQVAAARLQVYDLAARYQGSVASIVSWTLFVAAKVGDTAFQTLTTVATATNGITTLLNQALNAISTAGKALTVYVNNPAHAPLNVLLADSCAPLASLPAPAANASVAELLQDTQITMDAVTTAVTDIENRGRNIAADFASLAQAKSFAALVAKLPVPTKISFSFNWQPSIQSFEPVFLLDEGAAFTISAQFEVDALQLTQPSYNISASLTKFSINLIGSPSFVIIKVTEIVFTSTNGNKPDCRLTIDTIEFGDALSFVQDLASLLNPANGPFIEFSGAGVLAGFRFQVPDLTMGAFNMMQLAIEVAVQLSFNGDPVRCQFSISDQTHPFLLSSGIFGGGGFLQLQLGLDGVQLLQGALEFGVVAGISIGPIEGSGYVVAGIYMSIGGNNSKVCGFVHAHGHMDIFGLISMDVDVYVAVCYQNGVVQGIATFTVSVQILFFSESFSLQASYEFAGSGSAAAPGGGSDDALLSPGHGRRIASGDPQEVDEFSICPEEWAEYYAAFAA